MAYCPICNKILKGRSDKRFCNEICRNKFHNNYKISLDPEVRKFNSIKKLLASLPAEKQRIIVWAHLLRLLETDKNGLGWIMDRVKELLQAEEDRLLSPFQ